MLQKRSSEQGEEAAEWVEWRDYKRAPSENLRELFYMKGIRDAI
jgi:hypothetical protein